jgi:hypothetical protein
MFNFPVSTRVSQKIGYVPYNLVSQEHTLIVIISVEFVAEPL